MRIAVDLSFFIADQRGMGRVVRNVLREWLDELQDEWIFIVRKASDSDQLRQWLQEVQPALSPKIISFSQLAALRVDVCWYPWNRIDAVPLEGQKVVTINDVNPFVFPYRSIWRWWDQKKDERRFQQAVSKADTIVTISEFSRKEISRFLRVEKSKISVVTLGVDPERFMEGISEFKDDIPMRSPRLLYVGADDPRKNLPNLFVAIKILRDAFSCTATLVCCGTGDDTRHKYSDVLHSYGLTENVIFPGFVSDEQLHAYYQQADLFVFPSLYEGFGLPLLEAMAAGLPVVSSRAASLVEVAGDAAVYFDPERSEDIAAVINQTWQDAILRQELRIRGKERVASYSWQRTAIELKQILVCAGGH